MGDSTTHCSLISSIRSIRREVIWKIAIKGLRKNLNTLEEEKRGVAELD